MTDRLADKVAIVTGAGAGIGRASALAFAREGAAVLVADIDPATAAETTALITGAGGRATPITVDVAVPDQIRAMVEAAREVYGRVDVLHNNAGGVIWSYGTVVDVPDDLWDRVYALNVRSVFLGCKHVIPLMIAQGGGSIVNTASIGGLVAGPRLAAYGSSKAAVIQLTRSVAIDFAAQGIRANAICPGSVATSAMVRMFSRSADPAAARAAQEQNVPMGRLGTPEEIANLAVFLASDESSYVTGSVFTADGGYTAR